MVAWLQRKGWSNDPGRAGFLWKGSPRLTVAKGDHRQRGAPLRSTESLSSFLPLNVELTRTSTYDSSLSLSDSRQKLRLCKKS
eukprot:4924634-Pleurochrysis_carterae.AAC.1